VLASISLDFSPTTTLFGSNLRLETLALAGVIFLTLVLTGLSSGRVGAGLFERIPRDSTLAAPRLRRDDLILIAFGVVPGAVAGGRAGYLLVHLDYYRLHTDAILDTSQGGLNLTLAVLGGAITGLAVARLMNAPLGRWLAVSAVPVMLGLGLGKLAMVLGGAGQGAYSDAWWATGYVGPGPWESLNASHPSLPSQALEGGLVLAAMVVLLAVPLLLRLRLRRWHALVRPGLAPRHPWRWLTGGRRFLSMLALWAAMRFVAAFTWRDAQVLGRLNAEQLVLAGVVALAVLGPGVVFVLLWILRTVGHSLGRGWKRFRANRAALSPRAARAAAAANTSKLQAVGGVPAAPADPVGTVNASEAKLPIEDPFGIPTKPRF
jgi:Na+-transporting methylmalonyl-CoA/oxaloacetate decarboxylase gamma subunit